MSSKHAKVMNLTHVIAKKRKQSREELIQAQRVLIEQAEAAIKTAQDIIAKEEKKAAKNEGAKFKRLEEKAREVVSKLALNGKRLSDEAPRTDMDVKLWAANRGEHELWAHAALNGDTFKLVARSPQCQWFVKDWMDECGNSNCRTPEKKHHKILMLRPKGTGWYYCSRKCGIMNGGIEANFGECDCDRLFYREGPHGMKCNYWLDKYGRDRRRDKD